VGVGGGIEGVAKIQGPPSSCPCYERGFRLLIARIERERLHTWRLGADRFMGASVYTFTAVHRHVATR
jgi:hypothetical protein